MRAWARPCDDERCDRQRQRDCPLCPCADRVQRPDRWPRENDPVAEAEQATGESRLEPANAGDRDDDRRSPGRGRDQRNGSQGDTASVSPTPANSELSPQVMPTAQSKWTRTKAPNTAQTIPAATRTPFEVEVSIRKLEFPRFSGHLTRRACWARKDGVQGAQDSTCVSAGVPP